MSKKRGRKPKITENDIERMFILWNEEKWSQKKIAKFFGTCQSTVSKYLRSTISKEESVFGP